MSFLLPSFLAGAQPRNVLLYLFLQSCLKTTESELKSERSACSIRLETVVTALARVWSWWNEKSPSLDLATTARVLSPTLIQTSDHKIRSHRRIFLAENNCIKTHELGFHTQTNYSSFVVQKELSGQRNMATIKKSSVPQTPRVMTAAAIRREFRKRSGGAVGGKRPRPGRNIEDPALAVQSREPDQTDEESVEEGEPVRTEKQILDEIDNKLDDISERVAELRTLRERKEKARREKRRLRRLEKALECETKRLTTATPNVNSPSSV